MANEVLIAEEIAARVRTESARKAGKARLTSMSAEERKRIAKLAAQARWGKKLVAPEPPQPTDPKGPNRDYQRAEAGILSSSRRPVVSVSPDRTSGRGRAAAA